MAGVAFSELCEVHRANPRRAMAQLQSSGDAHGVRLDAAAPPPAAPSSFRVSLISRYMHDINS